ncbi:hypothetical protein CA838_06425 [Eikenella corrodens]|nr:hypothetical protein CA838_06425 [Eikenella corrodens]
MEAQGASQLLLHIPMPAVHNVAIWNQYLLLALGMAAIIRRIPAVSPQTQSCKIRAPAVGTDCVLPNVLDIRPAHQPLPAPYGTQHHTLLREHKRPKARDAAQPHQRKQTAHCGKQPQQHIIKGADVD